MPLPPPKKKPSAAPKQDSLFEMPADWEGKWKGMPEFKQDDLEPWQSVKVHFAKLEHRQAFSKLVGQTVTELTRSIWYPKAKIGHMMDRRYKTEEVVNPKYPVYVPTYRRSDSALTIKALEKLGVPYYAVIQPHELELYQVVVNTGTILTLPEGLKGLVPARNWIKRHSIDELRAARHWQIDDNINGFFRLHKNLKTPASSGAIFRAMEDFSDRYENVAISGPNYFMFAARKCPNIKPITLNTRVYSCSLINNQMDYWWRDVFNDDTDICLRALKDGQCTVLFNAFLCLKSTTMTVKGGNTDIYQGDGRKQMAESLIRQHPDVTKMSFKFGHWQHHVDYSGFRRNELKLREGVVIPDGQDNYGMSLEIDAK